MVLVVLLIPVKHLCHSNTTTHTETQHTSLDLGLHTVCEPTYLSCTHEHKPSMRLDYVFCL